MVVGFQAVLQFLLLADVASVSLPHLLLVLLLSALSFGITTVSLGLESSLDLCPPIISWRFIVLFRDWGNIWLDSFVILFDWGFVRLDALISLLGRGYVRLDTVAVNVASWFRWLHPHFEV